jgi:precorrin-2/cobalt-factor-2 C20-methyltransferase
MTLSPSDAEPLTHASPGWGRLFGVGVGPGDPDLISVKGLRCLQRTPIVAFPAGVQDRQGVAEQIIVPWLRPRQQTLALRFPYVQDPAVLQQAWHQAAQQVGAYLRQGQDVAFACEGDVNFYGTFTPLSQTVAALYPQVGIQTIPGISSPMAAAAALGIPLTVQRDRLVILPALYCVEELAQLLTWADVIVLLKVGSVYRQVWGVLQEHQLLDHSYVVVQASTPQQQIYRHLEQYPELELPYFSVMVIQR